MKRFAYLTALVASLALATGGTAATGAYHPDDRPTHGPGAIALEQLNDIVRPDDRPTHGPGAVALEQVTRFERVPVIAPGGPTAAGADGFDWLDAGIGAAAALGLALIAAGGVTFLLRRSQAPSYS